MPKFIKTSAGFTLLEWSVLESKIVDALYSVDPRIKVREPRARKVLTRISEQLWSRP